MINDKKILRANVKKKLNLRYEINQQKRFIYQHDKADFVLINVNSTFHRQLIYIYLFSLSFYFLIEGHGKIDPIKGYSQNIQSGRNH